MGISGYKNPLGADQFYYGCGRCKGVLSNGYVAYICHNCDHKIVERDSAERPKRCEKCDDSAVRPYQGRICKRCDTFWYLDDNCDCQPINANRLARSISKFFRRLR